jgi:hypothetical protein
VWVSGETKLLGRAKLGGSPTPSNRAGLFLFLFASLKVLDKKKKYITRCVQTKPQQHHNSENLK